MDTYDLDEDPPVDDAKPSRRSGGRLGTTRQRWWAGLLVALLVVTAAGATELDQRDRNREFAALLGQVSRAQSAVRYSDARIQSMVQYTSPQLTSARAPDRVRASLRQLVQQTAADRVAPLRIRREAIARLSVSRWHGEQRRARDTYLAYLDGRIAFLQAVAADLRALYRPHWELSWQLTAARVALLKVSPDGPSSNRIRELLP